MPLNPYPVLARDAQLADRRWLIDADPHNAMMSACQLPTSGRSSGT